MQRRVLGDPDDSDKEESWVGERSAPGNEDADATPPPRSKERISVGPEEAAAILEVVQIEQDSGAPADELPILLNPQSLHEPLAVDDFTPSVAGAYEIEVGRVVDGRYQIEALLGTGAVGLVYRCRHLVLDKDVAIKVLRPDFARDPEVSERLVVEAKAASAIGSAHIVETVDFGRLLDGSAFFVMEFLEGESLGELLARQEPLGAEEVLHIAGQISEALDEAHRAGIVHRDLKPDNVFLVTRGSDRHFVKILDFGIAKLARAESKLTRTGQVYGTPHYMSPEQAGGRPTDERTDIYGAGVILFEMLTGSVPFDAEEPLGILTQHLYDDPPDLHAVRPSLTGCIPGADRVVRKCLAKAPEDRYASMADLRADLERLRAGVMPEAVLTPAPPRVLSVPAPPSMITRGVYVLAALGLIVSSILAYQLYTKNQFSGQRPAAGTQPTAPAEPRLTKTAATAPVVEEDQRGTPVLVVVIPVDAKISRNGEDLGPMPVTVHVQTGEKVHLAISRSGFVTRRLTLDGSRSRVFVGLVAENRKLSSKRSLWSEAEAAADRGAAQKERDTVGGDQPRALELESPDDPASELGDETSE